MGASSDRPIYVLALAIAIESRCARQTFVSTMSMPSITRPKIVYSPSQIGLYGLTQV
jgi:hypothetical protein